MSMLDTLTGPPTPPPTTSGGVRFVLYDARDDVQADAFLSFMWRRMQQDDLVDYYFPGQSQTGYATFVRMMSGDAKVALVVTDSGTGQWNDTIAGFITWSTMFMGASEVIVAGFIFFRDFWDMHTTTDAGIKALQMWFENYPNANVVLGVCPSDHVLAIRYNKRIGLREMGRLPGCHLFKGMKCDAILFGTERK